ncbi:MAG: hypothetical protein IJU68_04650 [Bacteroidales bacterium]|nr:hypothetical protein [Bacteroidales bacterium]
MNKKCYLALASLTLLGACSTNIEVESAVVSEDILDVPVITAILESDASETRTSFEFSDYRLKASWSAGDAIAVVPYGYYHTYAGIYTLPDGGGTSADFVQTKAVGANASYYYAFYPGDKVKSFAQLPKMSLEGQVQSKDAPMAHLSDYFLMYKQVSNYSTIDFSDAVKTACMRVNLSGMTFNNPTKVSVRLIGGDNFCMNCRYPSSYSYMNDDEPSEFKTSKTITVSLEGYGSETELQAWIAMSNLDVKLSSGDKVRVSVQCSDGLWYSDIDINSNLTLSAGHCHSITADDNWKLSTADYTEYDFDGEVVTLQENGTGLDLVLMGDGFIAADFDGGNSSTYMGIMSHAADVFFAVQPYTYLRQFFNVYVVKVVSPERTNAEVTGANGARNTGSDTKLSVFFTPYTTSVSGDKDAVLEYASKALSADRLANATVIVIANAECRSGTCWNYWTGEAGNYDYGHSNAIAYFGRGTSPTEGDELVRHEAGGHGFGKLADEYTTSSYYSNPTGAWNDLADEHNMGFWRNTDRFVTEESHAKYGDSYPVTTSANVYWADLFGTVNNYESDNVESLGVFHGGNAFYQDFCRPTENGAKSIMNWNTGIFNAPSRRQILYRAKSLMGVAAGSWGSNAELQDFLEWDSTYFLPNLSGYLSSSAPAKVKTNMVEQYAQPLGAPQLVFGHWEGIRFVEE